MRVSVLPLLAITLLLVLIIAVAIGAVKIPLLSLLLGDITTQQQAVLLSIRLPRVLLAAIVGVGLATSGAAMQGLFRNPLADPGLFGISSSAALAVAIMIVIVPPAAGALSLYSLSAAAFTGGMLSSGIVFTIARLTGAFSVIYLLLAGIAISALTGAATGFLMYISNDQQLRALTFWTMGSVGNALWPAVLVCATIVIPTLFILIRNAQALNILLLGEQEAQHLGIDTKKLKRIIIICVALAVGAAVAVSGIIGFVGLVVPHIIRLCLGPDHRLLLPAAAMLGAILLIVADTFARTVVSPAEMPVGIITSLIGGPCLLWMLIKQYSARFS